MNKSILVTGANGQLGSELRELSTASLDIVNQCNFYFTDIPELDITRKNEIENFCKSKSISVIINCSAYTAVDKAEEESDLANSINNIGVNNLALVAKNLNIKLVHISTDYVFDGLSCKPYLETDITNPQGVYGISKLKGEDAIRNVFPANAVIIRTSWLYSKYGNNFVKTMLRLGKEKDDISVISDQVGTPTSAKDLAFLILKLLDSKENSSSSDVQLYHYSNEGVCSWYDFAVAIFEIKKITCIVKPIASEDYKSLAARPYYSVLNKNKIKTSFNLTIQNWRESLKSVLESLESQ